MREHVPRSAGHGENLKPHAAALKVPGGKPTSMVGHCWRVSRYQSTNDLNLRVARDPGGTNFLNPLWVPTPWGESLGQAMDRTARTHQPLVARSIDLLARSSADFTELSPCAAAF